MSVSSFVTPVFESDCASSTFFAELFNLRAQRREQIAEFLLAAFREGLRF